MRLQKVQDALNKKNIKFEYTEEDGCGSLDFMFRGLKFHVWEYEDNGWGAETNIYVAGRSEDIDGDYEEKFDLRRDPFLAGYDKQLNISGFHISNPDFIPESVRIMQFIIFCDKNGLHSFFLRKFQAALQTECEAGGA